MNKDEIIKALKYLEDKLDGKEKQLKEFLGLYEGCELYNYGFNSNEFIYYYFDTEGRHFRNSVDINEIFKFIEA